MKAIYKKLILIFGDLFCLAAALFSELLFRYWQNFTPQVFNSHLAPFSILFFISIILFYIFDLYELHNAKPALNFYASSILILTLTSLLGAILFYFLPTGGILPKTNLILSFLLGWILIVLWRGAFFSIFQDSTREKIAVVNFNSKLSDFLARIAPSAEYDVALFIETPKMEENHIEIDSTSGKYLPCSRLSRQKDLRADIVIIGEQTEDLGEWLPKIQNILGKPLIWDLQTAYEKTIQKIPLTSINVLWFAKYANGEKKIFERIKRIVDILTSLLFITIGIPFYLVIGIAIFIEDHGPIIYTQERIGKDKKIFKLLKFRSMQTNAESDGKALWASKDDQRITKVGKIIRALHLDELPQLFNILKGDISLIGPRPERPEFVKQLEKEIEYYQNRHLIKPGFTGWAQIKFRYARSIDDSREKFEYDLYYTKNRSMILDLKILLKTAQLFFKND